MKRVAAAATWTRAWTLRAQRGPGESSWLKSSSRLRRAAHASAPSFSAGNAPTTVAFKDLGLCAASLPAITRVKKLKSSSRLRRAVHASAPSFSAGNAPTTVAFKDLGLCDASLRAITRVKKFEFATAVQDQTLPHIMGGQDVLARATTGSGKTVGFLLPAIEALAARAAQSRGRAAAGRPRVLVLSPTRELAAQILDEAKALLTFHDGVGAQVVFGGTSFNTDLRKLREKRCDILVATPGRLVKHLEDGDRDLLCDVNVLVLDEADRLLDMGFKPSIEKILRSVPRDRQSLMFSATVSDKIKKIAAAGLRPGHVYVDCVGEEEGPDTNLQVKQSLATAPLARQMPTLAQIVDDHVATTPNHKIMCFFTTARGTRFAAELFRSFRDDVIEIHSKLSQGNRTKATAQFRAAKRAVMMTSDVTARGIDFPDVTLVVQIGIPATREQYIHRLGRTARAGKSGEGILVLAPHEEFFAKKNVGDLPISRATIDVSEENVVKISRAMDAVSDKTKALAYAAWLGFHKQHIKKMGWTPEMLVREANDYATETMGCPEPPPIMKMIIGRMGLKGVPGFNIVSVPPEYDDDGGRQR